MEFVETLKDITGTEEKDSLVRLIDRNLQGTLRFFNSGVGLQEPLPHDQLSFRDSGKYSAHYFRQGQRFNPTKLHMPPNTLDLPPHCHPGGEFAYVISGEYFDADMQGNPLRTYSQGSVIFYGKESTHRPLSHHGADILYIPFDGIVFGNDPEDLVRKMARIPMSAEAFEYALFWMVPDQTQRDDLTKNYFIP